MDDGKILVKFMTDESKNDLINFLNDNNFKKLMFDESSDCLEIDIYERTF